MGEKEEKGMKGFFPLSCFVFCYATFSIYFKVFQITHWTLLILFISIFVHLVAVMHYLGRNTNIKMHQMVPQTARPHKQTVLQISFFQRLKIKMCFKLFELVHDNHLEGWLNYWVSTSRHHDGAHCHTADIQHFLKIISLLDISNQVGTQYH